MSGSRNDSKQYTQERAYELRPSPHPGRCFGGTGMWLIVVTLSLVLITMPANSLGQVKKQSKKQTTKKTPAKSEPSLQDRVAKAKAEVVVAANNYKESLQKVLEFQQNDVKAMAETVEKRKALLAESIISKKEVEESERALATAEAKVKETEKQIGDADNLIAEAKAEEQLAKLGPSRLGAYQTTAALIRYNGPAHWVLSDASKVESFFVSKFRHALPISAFGQTSVHDQLGFDHRNAMDVAVSPDSSEGQALMDYLRSAGIPFIAFRYAVKGSATGAHIHVGSPSHRLGK